MALFVIRADRGAELLTGSIMMLQIGAALDRGIKAGSHLLCGVDQFKSS